jgi:hypothetical protein
MVGSATTAGNEGDRGSLSREDLVASPVMAVSTLEQVCDKLLEVRDTLGLTYFGSPVGVRPESLAPVIERLAVIS